jgi:hypothetical protein
MNFLRWARTQWDRVAGVIIVAIGAIAIIAGWHGVSREGLTAQQIPYVISGGIGGLFLLGVGGILWLSADLRDEWRKLDAIERTQSPDEHAALAFPVEDPFELPDPVPTVTVKPPTTARKPRAITSDART